MRVEVRYFASLSDLTGTSSETVEIDDAADVAALWQMLARSHPPLGRLGYRPMVALDLEYARWEDPLRGAREVAFLPPVSGG